MMSAKDTPKNTIGQVADIVLPELGKGAVQARVDTGANTSAIWASQVREQDGQLAVVFFGKGFPLYSGQPVVFNDFSQTLVSSSNGKREVRYKVQLSCVVAERRIRTWFTLANRSSQVYPVLIGRNTLRGKFLVDVTRRSRLQLPDGAAAARVREPRIKEQNT